MKTIATLQADARAKLEAEVREDIRNLQNYNFDVGETIGRFSDALVLSTALAIKREVVPDEITYTGPGNRLSVAHSLNRTEGWNKARERMKQRFDSLLGGDAKSV